MNLLDKFRNYMLGVEEEELEMDEVPEKSYQEESRPSRYKEADRPSTSASEGKLDYTTFKKRGSESNVVSLVSHMDNESKGKIIICRPMNVSDAPNVSDYLKQSTISVVNLEGVERADAQRIADFLGGVAYSLNCSIERISNDIFVIAPIQISISNELKEEIKTSKSSMPWISAFK